MKFIKGIVLTVALFIFADKVNAQEHYIGIRGGITGGNIVVQPLIPSETEWGNIDFGIMYKLIVGEKYLGGFQTEVSYVENAFKFLPREEADSCYIRKMSTIEIPFFWHPYYSFGNSDKVRMFVNAGPYLYYMTSSEYEYIDALDPTSDYNTSGTYEFNRNLDVRLGYGVMGGVGFEVMLTKRFQFLTEFRYKFAFSDIWKYKAKIDPALSPPTDKENEQMYITSGYAQSQVNQLGVSFGLCYRF